LLLYATKIKQPNWNLLCRLGQVDDMSQRTTKSGFADLQPLRGIFAQRQRIITTRGRRMSAIAT